MLRGRHRGLPDALDRAVLLPREFEKRPEQAVTDHPQGQGQCDTIHSVSHLPEHESDEAASQSSHTAEGSGKTSSENAANLNEKAQIPDTT